MCGSEPNGSRVADCSASSIHVRPRKDREIIKFVRRYRSASQPLLLHGFSSAETIVSSFNTTAGSTSVRHWRKSPLRASSSSDFSFDVGLPRNVNRTKCRCSIRETFQIQLLVSIRSAKFLALSQTSPQSHSRMMSREPADGKDPAA